MLTKKIKVSFLLIFLFVFGLGCFLVFKKIHEKSKIITNFYFNNKDQIFMVEVPDNFSQDQRDRLSMKMEEAKKAYDENIGDNWTWVIIGNMYMYAEDYNRSILAFQRASEIEPKDITAILNLANLYEDHINDYQKAEIYYSKAVTLFPDHADLYDRLAKLYWLKIGKPKDAEMIYLQGLDKVDDRATIILDLINFYSKTNQLDQQKIYIKKLLDTYPDNETYKRDFGNLIK